MKDPFEKCSTYSIFWYIFASLETYDILLSSITTLKVGAVKEYNYF